MNTTATSGSATRRPCNKWYAAQVTGLGALAVMYITTGGWDNEESVARVGLLVQAATTYLVTNSGEPAPVPAR